MRERRKELCIEELFCMGFCLVRILDRLGQTSPKEKHNIRLSKVRCKFFRSRWARSCHPLTTWLRCFVLFFPVFLARVFISLNQSGARRHTKVFPTIPRHLYF